MGIRDKLTRVFDAIEDTLMIIPGVLSILMMLGISADVVCRYLLNAPITGMQEASEAMLLYITFFSAAWILREEGHIVMDFIPAHLGPRTREWLNLVTSIAGAGITFLFVWYGFEAVVDLFRSRQVEPGSLEINTGYIVLAIPIGCIPLFIQFLRKSYRHWKEATSSSTSAQQAPIKEQSLEEV